MVLGLGRKGSFNGSIRVTIEVLRVSPTCPWAYVVYTQAKTYLYENRFEVFLVML